MQFSDLTTAWVVVSSAMAAVVMIAGFVGAIAKLYRWATKPTEDNSERLDDHDEKLDRDNRRINRIDEMLEYQKESNEMMLSCILQLMNHAIDGNHDDQMIERRNALNKFLISR